MAYFCSSEDHAHDEEDVGDSMNVFDLNEMIPYVDTILREDDTVSFVIAEFLKINFFIFNFRTKMATLVGQNSSHDKMLHK